MQRYPLFRVLLWCALVGLVVLAFTDTPQLHRLMSWSPLVLLPLVFAHLYLINRASRVPILVAARELQTRGNTSPRPRSE